LSLTGDSVVAQKALDKLRTCVESEASGAVSSSYAGCPYAVIVPTLDGRAGRGCHRKVS